jgi:hypothetical protein
MTTFDVWRYSSEQGSRIVGPFGKKGEDGRKTSDFTSSSVIWHDENCVLVVTPADVTEYPESRYVSEKVGISPEASLSTVTTGHAAVRMLAARATVIAVLAWSPVIITVPMLASWSAAITPAQDDVEMVLSDNVQQKCAPNTLQQMACS